MSGPEAKESLKLPPTSENDALTAIGKLPKNRAGYILARLTLARIMGKGKVTTRDRFGHRLATMTSKALLEKELFPPLPEDIRNDISQIEARRTLSHDEYGEDFAVILGRALDHDATFGRDEAVASQALVEQMGMSGAV